METKKTIILLAEDEENMGSLLSDYLNARGYQTDLYPDGEKAFKGFCSNKYDICILDVMMPKKDGFTLAHEIRQIDASVPIIFLTAKAMKEDVLEGFSSGADDYMTKPFSIEELQMRIDAIMRRTRSTQVDTEQDIFELGNYTFHYNKQVLVIDNAETKLTSKEADLLRLLCLNRNQVLDRNSALFSIWSDDSYFNARSMDVYITKLRKYFSRDPSVQIINIRGKGFKLIT
ncbi:MAG: response regulator transcription factor [Dysgonamonadaceae bacterium]|jgi:DNA-binding response OmpR family regulator|nr:response regulator transcription factor [Dysgonamonadaceae bacterium]